MPTFIDTSQIASGQKIKSSPLKTALEALDTVLTDVLDGSETFTTLTVDGDLLLTGASTTINAGSFAKTKSLHTLSAEGGGATDDLDSITGGAAGELLLLTAATGKTITLRDSIGNIKTANGENLALEETQSILLTYANSNWHVVGYNHTHTGAEIADLNTAIDSRLVAGGAFQDVVALAGEVLAAKDLIYIKPSDGKWWKMGRQNASNVPKVGPVRGICSVGGTTGASVTGRVAGLVGGYSGLTPGSLVYVSDTDGLYTQTRPTFADNAQRNQIVVGEATDATHINVRNYPVLFKLRRATVSNATFAVYHYADADTRRRLIVDRNGSLMISTTFTRTSDTQTDFVYSGGTLTYGEFGVELP